jgi:type VI secretion system protein VasD
MNLCRVLILAVSLLFISGCAHTPDVSAKMNMQAAEYLNPDINGQAAPLILSFYELKSPMNFKQASYFALANNASAVLQDDLVDKQTVEIRPGQKKTYRLSFSRSVGYIGITAGYRNIDHATWRAMVQMPPKADSVSMDVDVQSEDLQVRLNTSGDWL